jgi:hypothetical protein
MCVSRCVYLIVNLCVCVSACVSVYKYLCVSLYAHVCTDVAWEEAWTTLGSGRGRGQSRRAHPTKCSTKQKRQICSILSPLSLHTWGLKGNYRLYFLLDIPWVWAKSWGHAGERQWRLSAMASNSQVLEHLIFHTKHFWIWHILLSRHLISRGNGLCIPYTQPLPPSPLLKTLFLESCQMVPWDHSPVGFNLTRFAAVLTKSLRPSCSQDGFSCFFSSFTERLSV